MAIDSGSVAKAVQEIASVTGNQVRYSNGQWEVSGDKGWRPANPGAAEAFDAILSRHVDNTATIKVASAPKDTASSLPHYFTPKGIYNPGAGATRVPGLLQQYAADDYAARMLRKHQNQDAAAAKSAQDAAAAQKSANFGAAKDYIGGLGQSFSKISDITGIATAVGGLGAGASAIAGGAIGGIFGGGVIGAKLGADAGVILSRLVNDAIHAVASIVSGIINLVGTLIQSIGSGLHELISAGRDLIDTATKFADAVSHFSNRTGTPLGTAANAAYTGLAFGLQPSQTIGGSQESIITQYLGRIAGVSVAYGSVEALRQIRSTFGTDPGIAGRARIRAAGYGSYLESGALTESNDVFNRQADRSQSLQGAFGLSGDQIQKISQDWGGLVDSAGQFVELLKVKFAGELIPYLSGLLDAAVQYISQNAGSIAGYVKFAVHWLAIDMPMALLKGIDGMAETLGKGLVSIGKFTIGFADFIRSFESGKEGFGNTVSQYLGFADAFINSIKTIGGALAQTAGLILQISGALLVIESAQLLVQGNIVGAGLSAVRGAVLGYAGSKLTGLGQVISSIPDSNIRARFDKIRSNEGGHIGAAADYVQGIGNRIVDAGNDLPGTIHDKTSTAETFITKLDQIANNTAKIADATQGTRDNMQQAVNALLSQAAVQLATNTHFALSRGLG